MTIYEHYQISLDSAFKRIADKLPEEINSMKPSCCGEVIENTAMGKAFFYCRGCKSEVTASTSERPAVNVIAEMLDKNPPGPQPQAWVGQGVHGNGQPMVHGGARRPHNWKPLQGPLAGSQCTECGDFNGCLSASTYCPGPAYPQPQQSQVSYLSFNTLTNYRADHKNLKQTMKFYNHPYLNANHDLAFNRSYSTCFCLDCGVVIDPYSPPPTSPPCVPTTPPKVAHLP